MSTGRPKTTDCLISTVYLRHENNKVSDLINIETKDHVKAEIKVSYCVDFDPKYVDKWFSIDNYVKYLCDHERSLIKKAAKEYTIEEFYENYCDIVHDVAIGNNTDRAEGAHSGLFFSENGMYVHGCEVLSLRVQDDIARLLTKHQSEMVEKALQLSDANRRVELVTSLAEAEQKEAELESQKLQNRMNLQREEAIRKLEIQSEVNRKNEAEKLAAKQAENDMQVLVNAIAEADNTRKNAAHQAEMDRTRAANEAAEAHARSMAEIEKAKNESYAATVAAIMASISPDLVAALESQANTEVTKALSDAIAPYAIARGESVAEVVNKMTRGTTMEDMVKNFNK
jgi:major vault protein